MRCASSRAGRFGAGDTGDVHHLRQLAFDHDGVARQGAHQIANCAVFAEVDQRAVVLVLVIGQFLPSRLAKITFSIWLACWCAACARGGLFAVRPRKGAAIANGVNGRSLVLQLAVDDKLASAVGVSPAWIRSAVRARPPPRL